SASKWSLKNGLFALMIVTELAGEPEQRTSGNINKLLVAVDDSSHSRAVLEWVKQFPHSPDMKIKVVTVFPAVTEKYSDGIDMLHSAAYEGKQAGKRNAAEELLQKSC